MKTGTRFGTDGKPREVGYLSTVDTAKLIRKALKGAFPEVKFSVRSKSYSGGSSVSVSWIDGPTTIEVDRVVGRFSGATFDGMTDCKNYIEGEYNGFPVMFGPDFIFTSRSSSEEALRSAIDWIFENWEGVEDLSRPGIKVYDSRNATLDGSDSYVANGDTWLHRLIYSRVAETSLGGPYPGETGYEDEKDVIPDGYSLSSLETESTEEKRETLPPEPVEIPEEIFPDPETWEYSKL